MSSDRQVSALERLVRDGSDEDLRRFFLLLRPPELADLLENAPEDVRLRIVRQMNAPLASEVLRAVDEPERDDILEDLSAQEIAEIVDEAKSDDAADFLGALPPERIEEALGRLDRDKRRALRKLLEHDEETAGGIMQTECVTAGSDLNVGQAIEAVRRSDMHAVGEIHEVFVIDADGRLVGTVSPADLLHADVADSIRSVLEADPISVPLTMDQEQIAELAREHDLVTIPVVDDRGRLVGQVLHDDVADVIEEEATEDIAKMAGANPEEVYDDSVGLAVRTRAPWLAPAFVGSLLVSVLLANAEGVLDKLPMILAFLPVILGMAGNVGTQTSAITVRSLALGRLESGHLGVILRQALTGLSLGLLFGALLFAFVVLTRRDFAEARVYAMTLALALWTAMTVGASMGVVVPLILHRLGFDPAIATSPFVQTANDLTGAGILLLLTYGMGLV